MLEPVEFLLIASCLLPDERRSRWIVANMGLLVLGVVLGLVLQPALNGGALPPAKGVIYLVIGGVGYTVAEAIGHVFLERIPLGIYGMARVVLGTAFYHLLAFFEGSESDRFIGLRNLYSPRLWEQMAWYGFLFVTIGQWLWLMALSRCRPQTISLGTSTLFILNMVFSAIILGVAPTGAEYVGGAIILVSIGSSLLESWHHEQQEAASRKGEGKGDEEQGSSDGGDDGASRAPDEGPLPLIAREACITGSRV
jgi:drug/metabolite transporter (DMT)-like permease